MNILIFGGSGFIGKDFLTRFRSNFTKVLVFRREGSTAFDGPIYNTVSKAEIDTLSDIDVALHLAFDHSYADNFWLADAAHRVCVNNSCPLVYLSSFVVRGVNNGELPENRLSSLSDPYTLEKIAIKNHLESIFQKSDIPLIQVEPGIVFGSAGGWFEHVCHALLSDRIQLPRSGDNKAPFIYVGELSAYLYAKLSQTTFKDERILISGQLISNWRAFYSLFGQICERKVDIYELTSKRMHSNFFLHCIMYLVIFTSLGKLVFFVTPLLKRMFKIISRSTNKVRSSLSGDSYGRTHRNYGITHLIQSTNFELEEGVDGCVVLSGSVSEKDMIREMQIDCMVSPCLSTFKD